MRLLLDHHFSRWIAEGLRAQGVDAVTAGEAGLAADTDETVLQVATGTGRAVLTANVGDFACLAREWQGQDRTHAGLIFVPPSGPRSRHATGRYVRALLDLTRTEIDVTDRVIWLQLGSA